MATLPLCGTPTARPTCLFSEQTKYQWFLQSRVEVAVPIGNSTPPWGHRLLLLYGEKPQSYQHRQVGGELFLIGTDRKKKKKRPIHNNLHLQHQETSQKTTTQKLSVSSSLKACSCTYQVCSKEAGAFWRTSGYGQLYGFLPCLWIMQPPSLLQLSSTCVYKNTVLISMQASK